MEGECSHHCAIPAPGLLTSAPSLPLVFLRLRLNIIPGNFFWVKCVRFSPCHDRYFRKLPGDFRRFSIISEDFRTLPKIKCPKKFSKTFEHFRSHLKDDTFSVLWYDFVRTQKRTQSHHVLRTICPDLWVRREKLSLMREIDVFRTL